MQTQQHRILVVDDSPTNAMIVDAMLGDLYQVEIANCGESALEIAPRLQPDLVLLDIMMPGIDGYETCRQLRQIPGLEATKIMMLSAKTGVNERLKGYEAGANDYLVKPFEEDELLAKVKVYLQLKSVQEVDQLKSDLLSLLNHETYTPLNGILAPVELLRDAGLEAAEREMFLDMIQQSALQLKTFFEKINALSQLQAGHYTFAFCLADLGEMAMNAISCMAAFAAEHGVVIETTLPETAQTRVDTEQMQQVVEILMRNAIQASASEATIWLEVSQLNNRFYVTVRDRGKGIDAGALPHLFKSFSVTDIMHHTQGYGLSLAIAQQIVLAHGGGVEVESSVGEGTTFRVWLPVALD